MIAGPSVANGFLGRLALRLAAILLLVFAFSQKAQADCGSQIFKDVFLKSDGRYWSVVENKNQNPKTEPVTAITVDRQAVWVQTDGAEFYSVRTKRVGNSLRLENLGFYDPYPDHGAVGADFLAPYRQLNVRFELSYTDEKCTPDEVVLKIENLSRGGKKVTEQWLFKRTPPPDFAMAQTKCDMQLFRKKLFEPNQRWNVVKALQRDARLAKGLRAKVAPVEWIAGKSWGRKDILWLETYRDEPNTVGVRVTGNRLWLSPPMYPIQPVRGYDEVADMVRPYASTGVRFGLSPQGADCSTGNIVLIIENIPVGKGRVSERWLFVRKK